MRPTDAGMFTALEALLDHWHYEVQAAIKADAEPSPEFWLALSGDLSTATSMVYAITQRQPKEPS